MDSTTIHIGKKMAQTWTDIMVDIETTDTQPDRGAILQISAVKFNLKEGTVCPEFFDRCLRVPPHRRWSESTRNWWLEQRQETLMDILKRGEDWLKVINDFADFGYPQNHLRFWSKPTHFDYSFLSSYFSDAGLAQPFHYRTATDMNSFLSGLYYPNEVPKAQIEFDGAVHNALFDTLNQLKVLFHHVQELKPQMEEQKQQNRYTATTVIYEVNDAGETEKLSG